MILEFSTTIPLPHEGTYLRKRKKKRYTPGEAQLEILGKSQNVEYLGLVVYKDPVLSPSFMIPLL